MQYQIPVSEGCTFCVLSAYPNWLAVSQNRGKCQCLGKTPVHFFALVQGSAATLQNTLQLRIYIEVLWPFQQIGINATQILQWYSCWNK
ncbi:hypothetical protein D3C76_1581010 [compost metagenome]